MPRTAGLQLLGRRKSSSGAQDPCRKATARSSQLHRHTGCGGMGTLVATLLVASCCCWLGISQRKWGISTAGDGEHIVSSSRGPCHWEDCNKQVQGCARGRECMVSVLKELGEGDTRPCQSHKVAEGPPFLTHDWSHHWYPHSHMLTLPCSSQIQQETLFSCSVPPEPSTEKALHYAHWRGKTLKGTIHY